MRVLVALLASILIGLALPPLVGRRLGQRRVSREIRRLLSTANKAIGSEHLQSRYPGLPAPVRRYLTSAISADAPAIHSVHLTHGGTFRTAPGSRWWPITGEQFFSIARPGFVWHAFVRLAPLAWIEARDRLMEGRGQMLVQFASLIRLADSRGTELDQGAALRWLGECVWFPYGFVGDDVRWDAIDDHSAHATLRVEDREVQAVFEFDADCAQVTMHADRYRDIGGDRAVLTPFVARCTDFRPTNGFRVPWRVEASWIIDGEPFTYARFEVTSVVYNVAVD
jgi:Family of unknown function (DUF6544)